MRNSARKRSKHGNPLSKVIRIHGNPHHQLIKVKNLSIEDSKVSLTVTEQPEFTQKRLNFNMEGEDCCAAEENDDNMDSFVEIMNISMK